MKRESPVVYHHIAGIQMDRIKKNSVFTEASRLGLFSEGEEISQPTVTEKQSKHKKCTTMPLSAYLASRQPSPGFTSVQRGRQSRGQGARTNHNNNYQGNNNNRNTNRDYQGNRNYPVNHNNNRNYPVNHNNRNYPVNHNNNRDYQGNRNYNNQVNHNNNRNYQGNRNQGNYNNNRNYRQRPQAVPQPPPPSYHESFPNGLKITGRNAEVSKGQWSNGINAAVKNSDFEDPIHEQRRREAMKAREQRRLEAKRAELDWLNTLREDECFEQNDEDTDQEVTFEDGEAVFTSANAKQRADEEYAALLEKQKAEAEYEEFLAYCAAEDAREDSEWSD